MLEKIRLNVDGRFFIMTCSDRGFCVRSKSDGRVYPVAYDPEDTPREYEETDIKP